MSYSVNALTVKTVTHDIYSWKCPGCSTLNTSHVPTGANFLRRRCGSCHVEIALLPPAKPTNRKPNRR